MDHDNETSQHEKKSLCYIKDMKVRAQYNTLLDAKSGRYYHDYKTAVILVQLL